MQVDLGIWGKLNRIIVFLLVLAAMTAVIVWYLPLIKTNERMRKEILRLDAQIKAEEEASHQLEAAIKALRNDPQTVARLAREKLGYGKPGETIIYFEPGAPEK